MVVKVLISGLSASKEIKKHQQRAQMLLDSLRIKYETIDITEPGHEEEKELMKSVCKKRNNNSIALPPQFFNEDQYCGDYEDFSTASDDDTVLSFLKLEEDITIENGDVSAPEGMLQTDNDINSIVNGEKSESNDEELDTDEVISEVTTVEEKLTLDGKVIDIPVDKIYEIKGKKIDLNEMLFSKTKKLEKSQIISGQTSEPNEPNSEEVEGVADNSEEKPMETEDNGDNEERVETNDNLDDNKDETIEDSKQSEESVDDEEDSEED